jgi:hypothetical protein
MGINVMAQPTAVRLLLKFNFAQKIRLAGWSEGYDLGFADLATATADANLPNINAFILDRLQLLGVGPYLVEAVLSGYIQPANPGDPPPRRSSLSIPIPPPPPEGSAYNKAWLSDSVRDGAADFVTTDLYVSCETALTSVPVYHRNLWISGLPDQVTKTDVVIPNDPALVPLLTRFLGDLTGTNNTNAAKCSVQIRSINRGPALKVCTAWNLAANTYTVPAHGFAQNQPVVAEGMTTQRGGSCPRGRYLVGPPIDANTISLQGSTPPTAPIHTGAFRAAGVVFNALKVAIPQGMTKRNHGGPFGVLRGRRRRPATSRA